MNPITALTAKTVTIAGRTNEYPPILTAFLADAYERQVGVEVVVRDGKVTAVTTNGRSSSALERQP